MKHRLVFLLIVLTLVVIPTLGTTRMPSSERFLSLKFSHRADPFQRLSVNISREGILVKLSSLRWSSGEEERIVHLRLVSDSEISDINSKWDNFLTRYPPPYHSNPDDFDVAVVDGERHNYYLSVEGSNSGDLENFLFRQSAVADSVRDALRFGSKRYGSDFCPLWIGLFTSEARRVEFPTLIAAGYPSYR